MDSVSFLVAQGHVEASAYPVWLVGEETDRARERVNRQTHTNAVVMQQAMAASQSKKAFPGFKKLLEKFL